MTGRIHGKNRIPANRPKRLFRFLDTLSGQLPAGMVIRIPAEHTGTGIRFGVFLNNRPVAFGAIAELIESIATETKCRFESGIVR